MTVVMCQWLLLVGPDVCLGGKFPTYEVACFYSGQNRAGWITSPYRVSDRNECFIHSWEYCTGIWWKFVFVAVFESNLLLIETHEHFRCPTNTLPIDAQLKSLCLWVIIFYIWCWLTVIQMLQKFPEM